MQITSITLPAGRVPGVYQPVLDLTGTLAANLITGETQTIAPNAGSAFEFLIPTYAPFFTASFKAYKVNTDLSLTLLTLGIDYYFSFPFIGASRALGLPIYAGISFANTALTETIYLVYQTLGGAWLNTPAAIASTLESIVTDPCGVTWEQVANYSIQFPVVTTPWNLADPTTLSEVTTALAALQTTISNNGLAQNYASETAHLSNFDNAHRLTLVQLGLDQVSDLAPASNLDAMVLTNNSQYINPAQVNYMVTNLMTPATNTVKGIIALADGSIGSEASSTTLALTAATFSDYGGNPSNGIGVLVNKGQVVGTFSMVPTAFPRIWQSVSYPNLAALVNAVTSSVDLLEVEYNANLGCFYFPQGTIVPDLTLT